MSSLQLKIRAILIVSFLEASAFGFSSKEALISHDTHEQLTTNAIAGINPASYPDIVKFGVKLIDGGSTEGIGHAGAHVQRQLKQDTFVCKWADTRRCLTGRNP